MDDGLLDRWVAPLVSQPVDPPVPADDAAYRRRKGDARLAWRALRRELQYRISGQAPYRRDRIDAGWTHALWIHEEAPQIGDALMDLAARSLLAERGVVVDVLAPASIAALFDRDRWLGRSFVDPQAIDPAAYDFVIASSDSRRALATKCRRLPTLPWVSIAGRYNAPDFQRGLLGARRLADLLGVRLDATEEARHARQKLAPADAPHPGIAAVPSARGTRIAIACGGVRDERVYPHWPEVVRRLADAGVGEFVAEFVAEFVTIGSANGRGAADAIAAALPPTARLDDRVGRGDLHAARAAIAEADLLLAADGGLMHLALTTPTPIVALFTSTVDPAWRLPDDGQAVALRSATAAVGDIAVGEVVRAATRVVEAATGPFDAMPRAGASGHRPSA